MNESDKANANRETCRCGCDEPWSETDEALLERLAHRPLPAPSRKHRGRVLGQAHAEMARRRVPRCAQAGDPRRRAGTTGTEPATWWHALLKPRVLASGSAAALATLVLCLWGWQGGALRQAGEPENADAVLGWTGTTGGAAASGTAVDLDAHLDRVRERVADIVGGKNDSNIDLVLTRTHRGVAELESGARE